MVIFGINALEFFRVQILEEKWKLPIFRTKMSHILGRQTIVTFENFTLKFLKVQISIQNKRNLKLGSKNNFLDKFRKEFEKTIEISAFEFIKCKVWCKTKKLWAWNQSALFGYFYPEFKKLLPYFISAPSNLEKHIFLCQKKNKKTLGPKCLYLGTIRLEFEKIIIMFEINTLEFFKMPSFT